MILAYFTPDTLGVTGDYFIPAQPRLCATGSYLYTSTGAEVISLPTAPSKHPRQISVLLWLFSPGFIYHLSDVESLEKCQRA